MKYEKLFRGFFKDTIFAQILLALVFVGVIFLFRWSSRELASGQAMIIISLNQEARTFVGPAIEEMTLLNALGTATTAGNIRFEYALSQKNTVNLMRVGDQLNNVGGKAFRIYLNSVKIDTLDLNNIILKPGDRVELKFE